MIKVEKLENDCQAFINGNEQLLLGQLITPLEFETISVVTGSITLSIHEQELVTLHGTIHLEAMNPANPKEVSLNTQETLNQVKSPEFVETATVVDVTNVLVETPAIVSKPKEDKPGTKLSKPKAK